MINDNKAYAAFFNVLLVFLVLACLIPFWLLIASSFTSETTLVQNGYSLFPQEWNIICGQRADRSAGPTL